MGGNAFKNFDKPPIFMQNKIQQEPEAPKFQTQEINFQIDAIEESEDSDKVEEEKYNGQAEELNSPSLENPNQAYGFNSTFGRLQE